MSTGVKVGAGVIGLILAVFLFSGEDNDSVDVPSTSQTGSVVESIPEAEDVPAPEITEPSSFTEFKEQLVEEEVPEPEPEESFFEEVLSVPAQSNCHPGYSGCLKADASDYDCASGSGNGPYYTGPVQVYGSDPFGLDGDNDGWGCE